MSGRFGTLAHELFEVEAHNGSIRPAGEYYDVRVNTRMTGLQACQLWLPTRPDARLNLDR